jgi:hypothetical protein
LAEEAEEAEFELLLEPSRGHTLVVHTAHDRQSTRVAGVTHASVSVPLPHTARGFECRSRDSHNSPGDHGNRLADVRSEDAATTSHRDAATAGSAVAIRLGRLGVNKPPSPIHIFITLSMPPVARDVRAADVDCHDAQLAGGTLDGDGDDAPTPVLVCSLRRIAARTPEPESSSAGIAGYECLATSTLAVTRPRARRHPVTRVTGDEEESDAAGKWKAYTGAGAGMSIGASASAIERKRRLGNRHFGWQMASILQSERHRMLAASAINYAQHLAASKAVDSARGVLQVLLRR